MQPRGAFKISNRRRPGDAALDPWLRGDQRTDRLLDSLRTEIVEGGGDNLRIRRVFQNPREIFRLEIDLPERGYQRTTLLDRDALEELLEADEVREVVDTADLGGPGAG